MNYTRIARRMRILGQLVAVAGLVLTLGGLPPSVARAQSGNCQTAFLEGGPDPKGGDNTVPVEVDGTLIQVPNHKMIDYIIRDNAVDQNGNPIPPSASTNIIRITQDEHAGSDEVDAIITSPQTFQVRAERDGDGDGRVYHVDFTITHPDGNVELCGGGFSGSSVEVRKGNEPAVDSGVAACVGQC